MNIFLIPSKEFNRWITGINYVGAFWLKKYFLSLLPFLLGARCSRSSRILFNRPLCASLLPRMDGWRGEEESEEEHGASNASCPPPPPLSREPSSVSLLSPLSSPSSSSSMSSSSPLVLFSCDVDSWGTGALEPSWAVSISPSPPLPPSSSPSLEKPADTWSHDVLGEGSSSQVAAPLGRSLFQAERPPFLL